jgi:hypothetical protein
LNIQLEQKAGINKPLYKPGLNSTQTFKPPQTTENMLSQPLQLGYVNQADKQLTYIDTEAIQRLKQPKTVLYIYVILYVGIYSKRCT